MRDQLKLYIDGQWVAPHGDRTVEVVNPATEAVSGRLALGDAEDVNRAVKAARQAFATYSLWSREDRVALFERIVAQTEARQADLAAAITEEMGAPDWLALDGQAKMALDHARIALDSLRTYAFDRPQGTTLVTLTPIGVCGLITPWNFPAGVVMCKVLPALATGCTVVLKPSEYTPYSARIIAEIMHDAGVPAGVFNLVFGDAPTVGDALSGHPDVDMVSITGSTRAGIAVAINAAGTVKRVHQELGGKSANIILPSADIDAAVQRGVKTLMMNSGQGCSLPSRMIVPNARMEEVKAAVGKAASQVQPGPAGSNAFMGPVVNKNQYDSIQAMIEAGVAEGATVVMGGPGKPEGLETGFYIKPTVFADTTPEMSIVRQEIFGPVLVIQGYDDVEQAVVLANDTEYGLAAYVEGGDLAEVRAIAARLPAGQVYLNGAAMDLTAPFGGFKQSGNGREWGPYAFEAFLETKAIVGYGA